MAVIDAYVNEPLVKENRFIGAKAESRALPTFESSRALLPDPLWDGHPETLACYWDTWRIAFSHLCQPSTASGFVARFIDTAFNDSIFMWDSAFILMFARYGARAFGFQCTLDNFYAKQHPDGFICREIRREDGVDKFERFHPVSTGPNVLPWCEWEYFLNMGDRERLAAVFAPLLAFTRWFRKHRTWPDGTYFSSGWGCGMDNQPRLPEGCHEGFDHGHMTWIDTTIQQILADQILVRMAQEIGRAGDAAQEQAEIDHVSDVLNRELWDEANGWYCDRFRDGSLSPVKSIASFWALIAQAGPANRLERLVSHLEKPAEFNRPHRVPSLSADHPQYDREGGYWRGAIWAPTNYMVLRGLTKNGYDTLAHEIALNHLENVVRVHGATGTLWENYSPEKPQGMSGKDFVGWTGLPPVAVLFEYVFGLRPNVPAGELFWDVRLTERHGVKRYPFGPGGLVDLVCAQRPSARAEPVLTVASSSMPVSLVIRWEGGEKRVELGR